MNTINVGIIAHVDAGKTTVTENILYLSGVTEEIGRVDKGNTQTDTMELERKRGISIKASSQSFEWRGVKVNLIDTPGHVDFVSEVERSLNVLDGVVIVVSAKEGIQAQTRVLIDTVKAQKIPAIIFISKLDRVGADSRKLFLDLERFFGGRVISMQNVFGEESRDIRVEKKDMAMTNALDLLCETDDELMYLFANDKYISEEMLKSKIKASVEKAELYPVLYGSALYGIGVMELLETIVEILPIAQSDVNSELSAVVYKVCGEGVDKKAYVRIYKGKICLRDTVCYKGKSEKVKRLAHIENGKIIARNEVYAGDIAILYFRDLKIGDILGGECELMKNVSIAKPTLRIQIRPIDILQRRKLYETLSLLSEEDPLLEFDNDIEQGLMFVNIFGEIQMEILRLLLEEEYGIKTEFLDVTTIYKEAPSVKGSAVMYMGGEHNAFAAGAGFEVEPLERGRGLVYSSKVWLGTLEKTFQIAIREAVIESCKYGIFGWEITDASVTLVTSQYDSVCSTPSDFRNLTPMVLMEAFINSQMILLEPVLEFDLRVPIESASKAIFDCQIMNAEILNTEGYEEEFSISGYVPVDKCKNYSSQVASYSGGRGMFITKLNSYRQTGYDDSKINYPKINIACNKKKYLLHKLNAIR